MPSPSNSLVANRSVNITRRPLVLALVDLGLRSLLVSHLTMNGEMPILCADHRNPGLGEALRGAAILVIEESLIAATPAEWAETLRDQCWTGALIIIVDHMSDGVREADGIALVDRQQALRAVTELVRDWQSNSSSLVNSPQ